MDIELKAGSVSINSTSYGRCIELNIEDIDKSTLDTKEIAECISVENFFAVQEDEIKDYIKANYDWFEEEK